MSVWNDSRDLGPLGYNTETAGSDAPDFSYSAWAKNGFYLFTVWKWAGGGQGEDIKKNAIPWLVPILWNSNFSVHTVLREHSHALLYRLPLAALTPEGQGWAVTTRDHTQASRHHSATRRHCSWALRTAGSGVMQQGPKYRMLHCRVLLFRAHTQHVKTRKANLDCKCCVFKVQWDMGYSVMKLEGKALFIMQSYHPCAEGTHCMWHQRTRRPLQCSQLTDSNSQRASSATSPNRKRLHKKGKWNFSQSWFVTKLKKPMMTSLILDEFKILELSLIWGLWSDEELASMNSPCETTTGRTLSEKLSKDEITTKCSRGRHACPVTQSGLTLLLPWCATLMVVKFCIRGEKKRLNQTDLVFQIQYHNRKKG